MQKKKEKYICQQFYGQMSFPLTFIYKIFPPSLSPAPAQQQQVIIQDPKILQHMSSTGMVRASLTPSSLKIDLNTSGSNWCVCVCVFRVQLPLQRLWRCPLELQVSHPTNSSSPLIKVNHLNIHTHQKSTTLKLQLLIIV